MKHIQKNRFWAFLIVLMAVFSVGHADEYTGKSRNLDKLEDLYKQGLISKQEYEAHRAPERFICGVTTVNTTDERLARILEEAQNTQGGGAAAYINILPVNGSSAYKIVKCDRSKNWGSNLPPRAGEGGGAPKER